MHKFKGFTLIEVMIVVVITAIMIMLAIPSFQGLMQSNAVSGNVNSFMADVRFARSEAVRRGGAVLMCSSDNPEAASPQCKSTAGAKGWASGWIIFEDRDSSLQYSVNDQLLKVQSPITNLDRIFEKSGATVSGAVSSLQFTAIGRLRDMQGAVGVQFGGDSILPTRQRVVCINASGRARIVGDGNSSCSTMTDQ